MKFKQYGYQERVIEERTMTMSEIVLTIAQGLIRNNIRDMEIRIVDCFMGEVEIYKGLDDLLSKDWSGRYEVNVYDWGIMDDVRTHKVYFKLIISDNVDEVRV